MTAIVYCNKTKQIAVDSRSTTGNGEILSDSSDKVLLVRDEVWFISGFWFEADIITWGVGSGGTFAYCALDFGKTAKEAVEYAATKDTNTGGKVRVFNLDGEEVQK